MNGPERRLAHDLYSALTTFLNAQTEELWTYEFDPENPGDCVFTCERHEVLLSYAEWTTIANGNILASIRPLLEAIRSKHLTINMQERLLYGRE